MLFAVSFRFKLKKGSIPNLLAKFVYASLNIRKTLTMFNNKVRQSVLIKVLEFDQHSVASRNVIEVVSDIRNGIFEIGSEHGKSLTN